MKEKLLRFLKKIYYLKDKIAFYPTIIAFSGVVFTYIMLVLEVNGISSYIQEYVPVFVINDIDTARTILSTFIGGLISIMVFSFSMVMILLNQASNNFSPRLLPGLISNRRHQIVLGIYLATIIYCVLILILVEPNSKTYQLPGFSVLLSILFILICLGAFIYFIHSISQEIQINVIMSKIARNTKHEIKESLKYDKFNKKDFPNSNDWKTYSANSSGYLQGINTSVLKSICKENDIQIDVTLEKGSYCYENFPMFKLSKEIDEEILKKIYRAFTIFYEEKIEENFNLGFKHLTEIVLKAMSPGINDPGTAIYALDFLSELLTLRIQKEDYNILYDDEEEKPLIKIEILDFKDLLHSIMISLKTYCKHDYQIVKKTYNILKNLYKSTDSKERKEIIKKEIELLLEDAENAIESKSIREELAEIKKLQSIF